MDIDNGYTTAKDFYEKKVKELEAQNEIMREALFQISEDDENVCLHSDDAVEALKKVREV